MQITELQNFIKERDYNPELKEQYFMKLIEKVGELSEVIRKDKRMNDNDIKYSIEEELYDVLYYVCALANCYDIDLEKCHKLKSELNKRKWYSNENNNG